MARLSLNLRHLKSLSTDDTVIVCVWFTNWLATLITVKQKIKSMKGLKRRHLDSLSILNITKFNIWLELGLKLALCGKVCPVVLGCLASCLDVLPPGTFHPRTFRHPNNLPTGLFAERRYITKTVCPISRHNTLFICSTFCSEAWWAVVSNYGWASHSIYEIPS